MKDTLSRIETLIKSLASEDHSVCDNSCSELAAIGNDAVGPLIQALTTDNDRIREMLSWILVEIGQPAVPSLISILGEGNVSQRISATEILGLIGNISAIGPLIISLKDENSDVRDGAAWALVRIGEPSIGPLIQSVNDKSSFVRHGAAWALAGIGDPAVEALINALSGATHAIQQILIDTLVEIKETSVQPLLDLLDNDDAEMRMLAADALGRIGSPLAIDHLISSLKDRDRIVRRKSVEALAKIGHPAFEQLFTILSDNDDEEIRDGITLVFGIAGRQVISMLVEKISTADADLRRRIVRTFGIIKAPASVPALLNALHDTDNSVRDLAAWALGEIEDRNAFEPLLALLGDPTMEARYSLAAWALGKLKAHDATGVITEFLKSPHPHVRWRAALTLGILRDRRAVGPLTAAIHDADPDVRKRIISSLGDIGDPAAVEPLTRLLTEDGADYWLLIKDTLTKIKSRRADSAKANYSDHYDT